MIRDWKCLRCGSVWRQDDRPAQCLECLSDEVVSPPDPTTASPAVVVTLELDKQKLMDVVMRGMPEFLRMKGEPHGV